MPYTVYKVTNKLTGEFYIGVHRTQNPNDNYLGSGKNIRTQVALYGPENFTKEILHVLNRRHDAYALEIKLIEPVLGTPLCLNIHPGGKGGFAYLGKEKLQEAAQASARAIKERCVRDPVFAEAQRQQRRRNIELARENGTLTRTAANASAVWVGQHHTSETRSVMAQKKRGASNPCHGTCWVLNPLTGVSQRIPQSELDSWITTGWVRGRRCNMSVEGRARIGATGRKHIAYARSCRKTK